MSDVRLTQSEDFIVCVLDKESGMGVPADIPEEKLEWIRDIEEEYRKVQTYLWDLYDGVSIPKIREQAEEASES